MRSPRSQSAIDAAAPGDTIVVRGTHRENVVIGKDGITLRGVGAVLLPPAVPRANACYPDPERRGRGGPWHLRQRRHRLRDRRDRALRQARHRHRVHGARVHRQRHHRRRGTRRDALRLLRRGQRRRRARRDRLDRRARARQPVLGQPLRRLRRWLAGRHDRRQRDPRQLRRRPRARPALACRRLPCRRERHPPQHPRLPGRRRLARALIPEPESRSSARAATPSSRT